jgi:lysozyme family protein
VTPRRPWGRIVLALVFAFFGINAFAQAVSVPLGDSSDPVVLAVLQTLVGAAGLATAFGSWTGRRWAPIAALAYGVITGGMIASLGLILALPKDEWPGLYAGGASVLTVGLVSAWYLRRSLRTVRPS